MKFLFLSIFFSLNISAQIIVTEETLDSLLPENPNIMSMKERVTAAEVLKGSLTRSFLPKVELSYGRERYTTGPYYWVNQPFGGIEAKVNIYNSGRDQLENEQRNKKALIAKIDSDLMRLRLKAELLKSLAQFAYLNELVQILSDASALNKKNLKLAQERIVGGIATKTDILDFRQQEIVLDQEITSLRYEIGIVKRMITTLIGRGSHEELQINFQNSHPEHARNLKFTFSVDQTPFVQRANLLSDVSMLTKREASRWWTPSLDIYGYALRFTQKEREYPTVGERNDVGMGFRLTFPIFDGGEGYRVVQARNALARSAEVKVRSKKLEIEREIIDAKSKLELAHDLIHGAEDNVNLMEEYRRGILSEYNRGVKNSPDLLQASHRWIRSRMQFAEVKKSYQFAKAESFYLGGVL